MKTVFLKEKLINDFINYCKRHRGTTTDTNLHDEVLENFIPDENTNPTYLLLDDDEKTILGVASLIIDSYSRQGREARFRFFHCVKQEKYYYQLLLKMLLPHTIGLKKLYIFLSVEDTETKAMLEEIKFTVEGYSYDMIREDIQVKEVSFPDGYELRTFQIGRDEEDWCEIRNIGFTPPRTPETVPLYWEGDEALGHFEDGMMILYYGEKPVGTVRASKELEDDIWYTFISVLCVRPEYRRMGLGKNLLRAGLHLGRGKGYPEALLCVDPENEKALDLYIDEGFKEAYGSICLRYDL